jgi:uncharacterized RDD family membrane protein YckC
MVRVVTQPSSSYGAQGLTSGPGGFGSPGRDQGQQGGRWPAYGQDPAYLAPQQSGRPPHPVPSTPDGVPLSGWWERVFAWIIDRIIVFIVALPLTFVPLKRAFAIFGDVFQRSLDALPRSSSTSRQVTALLSAQMGAKIALVGVILLVVYLVYEVAFLTLTGATPGKRAVGISVRLRDEPGPPPLLAVLKRTVVKEGGGILARVPLLGFLLWLFSLVNVLWPLWDHKKQAIHDKVAATNAVVGSQPRRSA